MELELVSIIVPVYKAENYIKECLQSILKQTYYNIEVILVDDGSPDKCPEICDEWVKKDSRVRVIHQENSGVSVARNSGIKESTGEWIVFLDADDKMVPEAIESAWIHAKENDCDTVCWNCYKECDGTISKYPSIKPDNSIYQGDKMSVILIESLYQTRSQNFYPGHMFRAVWGKLLSAKVIKENNITFPVGQPLGEDAAFLVDYFQVCSKVILINQYWNIYKISSSSAVRQHRNNLKELQRLELELLCEKIKAVNVDKDTILLNQYLQFNYQYVHNLYQKENKFSVIFKDMTNYIRERKYQWKCFCKYDSKKIHKKSMLVVWAMVHKFVYIEALLCMLREQKHH